MRKRCNSIRPILAIQTLWLLFKEQRADSEERFVQCLLAQSDLIARTHEFVRRFRQILTDRDETALQPWAYEAEASRIPELVRFVHRLRLDWEAVENALLFASSQGQVEGQVNRLKVGHRDKAMDALVLLSYKHDYWEQASSTESGHDPILHRRVEICTEGWNLTRGCREKPLRIQGMIRASCKYLERSGQFPHPWSGEGLIIDQASPAG